MILYALFFATGLGLMAVFLIYMTEKAEKDPKYDKIMYYVMGTLWIVALIIGLAERKIINFDIL